MNPYVVYVTTRDREEAKRIAETVVQERLAACANVHGAVECVYWWEGRVCKENETVLLLKTSGKRKSELIQRIRKLHSYDTPCIVCLSIADGNPDFLNWLENETAPR
jgi:periplasmic divalent cation tolerance protein